MHRAKDGGGKGRGAFMPTLGLSLPHPQHLHLFTNPEALELCTVGAFVEVCTVD